MYRIDIPRIAVAYMETALSLQNEYSHKNPVIFTDNYASFYANSNISCVIDLNLCSQQAVLDIFFRNTQESGFAIVVTENEQLIRLLGLVCYRGGDVFADAATARELNYNSYDFVTLNLPHPADICLLGSLPKNDMDIFVRFGGNFTSDSSVSKIILTENTDIDTQNKIILAIAEGYKAIYSKIPECETVISDFTLLADNNGIKYGYFKAQRDTVLWIKDEVVYFSTTENEPKMICKDDILALNFHICFEDAKHWAKMFCEL